MDIIKWKNNFMKDVISTTKVCLHSNGTIYSIEYNKLHNISGPAIVGWHNNGNKFFRGYFLNGKRHNNYTRLGEEKPAHIVWYINGNKKYREYSINGKEHNHFVKNGELGYKEKPARVWYNENSDKESELYYLNGELMSDYKNEFL